MRLTNIIGLFLHDVRCLDFSRIWKNIQYLFHQVRNHLNALNRTRFVFTKEIICYGCGVGLEHTYNFFVVFPPSLPTALVVHHHTAQLALMFAGLLPHDGSAGGRRTAGHGCCYGADRDTSFNYFPTTCPSNHQSAAESNSLHTFFFITKRRKKKKIFIAMIGIRQKL